MKHGPSRFNDATHRHIPAPSTCRSGKVSYAKHSQATRAIKKLTRKANPRRMRGRLYAYRCVYCRQWHISSAALLPAHMRRGPGPPT